MSVFVCENEEFDTTDATLRQVHEAPVRRKQVHRSPSRIAMGAHGQHELAHPCDRGVIVFWWRRLSEQDFASARAGDYRNDALDKQPHKDQGAMMEYDE